MNGTPSCTNSDMLQGQLRNAWGFDSFVVSDCGAIGFAQTAHHYVKVRGHHSIASGLPLLTHSARGWADAARSRSSRRACRHRCELWQWVQRAQRVVGGGTSRGGATAFAHHRHRCHHVRSPVLAASLPRVCSRSRTFCVRSTGLSPLGSCLASLTRQVRTDGNTSVRIVSCPQQPTAASYIGRVQAWSRTRRFPSR